MLYTESGIKTENVQEKYLLGRDETRCGCGLWSKKAQLLLFFGAAMSDGVHTGLSVA